MAWSKNTFILDYSSQNVSEFYLVKYVYQKILF